MSSKEQPDMNEMKKKFESKPESEQKEILYEDQLEAKSVDNMNEMKKKFESKPESEQKEILYEDQLEAKSVDKQLEQDTKLSALDLLNSKLDQVMTPEHYEEKKYIFSDKDIEQKTQRIENIPIDLSKRIKILLSDLEQSYFFSGDNNAYHEYPLNEVLNKEDMDYIANRFQTQFKTELVDLEDGSKKIDIIPEGSKIRTRNNITINRLSIVFENAHSHENKDNYYLRIECVKE